jgi:hypothetical protein
MMPNSNDVMTLNRKKRKQSKTFGVIRPLDGVDGLLE